MRYDSFAAYRSALHTHIHIINLKRLRDTFFAWTLCVIFRDFCLIIIIIFFIKGKKSFSNAREVRLWGCWTLIIVNKRNRECGIKKITATNLRNFRQGEYVLNYLCKHNLTIEDNPSYLSREEWLDHEFFSILNFFCLCKGLSAIMI